MAVQEFTAVPLMAQGTIDFARAVFAAAEGPGKTPPVDGRELAGYINMHLNSMGHTESGTVVATADAAADGLDVLLGFAPKMVILFNLTQVELVIKMSTMAGEFAAKLTGGPAFDYADNRLLMGNVAADNAEAFHYDSAEITAADVIHFVAMA